MTMRSTDALIDSLTADVAPVRAHMVESRVLLGLALGGIVTALVVLYWLGMRPDFAHALYGSTIWMKWAYTLSLAAVALVGAMQLARPERQQLGWLWFALLPVILLAGLAMAQLATTPVAEWRTLWMGDSWRQCSMRVALLAVPIFGGLLWAFRKLAPTRLRLTGAMAGLAAGGFAATLYGFACPETSALFVLTWYSLGILVAMGVGALLGPRVLRW